MFRTIRTWKILLFLFSLGVLGAMMGASLLAYERAPSPTPVMRGFYLAQEMGCFACHGPGGVVGVSNEGALWGQTPPFRAGGSIMSFVQSETDIREWIMYGLPKRLWFDGKKPGKNHHKSTSTGKSAQWAIDQGVGGIIKMPAFEGVFTGSQMDDLVAFVKAVTDSQRPMSADAELGRKVASKLGCFGCHGVSGRGGMSNPGSFKGYIPPWDGDDYAVLVENDEELKEWILKGRIERFEKNPLAAYFTNGQIIQMPAFEDVLQDGEMEALIDYIHWLRKDGEQSLDFWIEKEAGPLPTVVARGKWLFHRSGCAACHGPGGIGGVPNKNASGGFVPSLNDMAERLELFEPEDTSQVVAVFERGLSLDDQNLGEVVPEFENVQEQYKNIRDFIITGGYPGKSSKGDGEPVMLMPAWKYRLYADGSPTSRADIDAIIAYLLTLQTFEDEDE
ncbi:MAG: c-type cytochrome [Psychrosphaera sp.]|nr:c-type cytochrome [Psychrosphaera sp.]